MDAGVIPGIGLDRAALDRARLSRDPRFDGRFFIAVLSTRIYCRPICPAPSPKLHNVRYYPTAAAAAEAGFRPCLRCRPEAAPDSPAWLGASAVVRRALRLIDEGALDTGSVEALSDRLGIGGRHLRRLFVKHVGASPIAVAQTRRLQFAKRLIDETNMPMTAIALASGYGSVRRFNAVFRATYQRTPSDLRRRRRGRPGNPDGIVLRLPFHRPYDWQGMLEYLARRAIPGLEQVGDARYARTVAIDGGSGCILVRSSGGGDALEFEVRGADATTLFALVRRARRMFDVAADPARIELALRKDPLLAPLLERYPGLRIPGAWDGFECAVRAVLGDGSSGRGRRLLTRLVDRYGAPVAFAMPPEASLSSLFPSPSVLAAADLRPLGADHREEAAIHALARAVADGRIDFGARAETLIPRLACLPGFGDVTAQYVALRALGEPDALPLAEQDWHAIIETPAMFVGRELSETSRAWRPWRGYAALYLMRATEEDAGSWPRAVSQ